MKMNYHNIKSFVLILFLTLFKNVAAQINIQVKIMPPYQSHIAEYASRPDLILMTLTNTSDVTQNIQLRGHISGDNGILISLKEGFRSSSPIEVGPMQTRSLNATEVAHLFNYSNLNIVGISEQDFIRGAGLPEGNYDFCIQAFDYYEPMVPLSPEEPMGCTMLSITNLEPPTIIAPFNEQELINVGVQSFPITWSTPPGAPPTLEYHVRMVEVFADQNPHDAILNTRPLFERTAHNNTILYGPADPALIPGRKYAMVVEAKDPFGKLAIRNHGRSEVVVFTYGESTTLAQGGVAEEETVSPSARDTSRSVEKELATHKIRGSLKWAFRQSEESLAQPASSGTGRSMVDIQAFTPQLGNLEVASRNVNPKLISPVAVSKKDPTVMTNYNVGQVNISTPSTVASSSFGAQGNLITGTAGLQIPVQNIVASSSGTSAVEFNKVSSKAEPSPKVFPLAGVKLILKAETRIRKSIPLGTVETDAEGNFTLELTDPKFIQQHGQMIDHLSLSVNAIDFERYEYKLPLEYLEENHDIDVGDHTLVAKTFRFNPSFTIDSPDSVVVEDKELEVMVYRERADVEERDYLRHEGNLGMTERVSKTINGKEMVAVAKAKVHMDESSLFAPLFYSGEHIIEIIPSSAQMRKRNAKLSVDNQQVNRDEVLVYSPQYKLQAERPAISGKVTLQAGTNTKGVAGAYVQVTYEEEDLLVPPLQMFSMPLFVEAEMYTPGVENAQATTHTMVANTGQAVPAVYTTTVQPQVYAMALPAQVNSQGQTAASAGVTNAATTWMSGQGSSALLAGSAAGVANMEIPPIVSANIANLTYDLNAPYTVQTDSTGSYYVGNLPVLKPGAEYTIRLVKVPSEYSRMPVAPESRAHLFSVGSGATEYKEFTVTPSTISVAGIVLDDQNQPVRNARLNFGGSSTIFESDSEGKFTTDYFAGNHTIHVRKTGYVEYEQKVSISESSGQDIGQVGPVGRMVGKVRFVVHDSENETQLLSQVEIALNDTTYKTDNSGEWLYEGISGETLVTFSPDGESGYVATQHSIEIEANGEVTDVYVGLSRGVRVYGKVSSSNTVVSGAQVSVEGKPYLKAETDGEGLYSLYVPEGEEIIQAGKSGYFTDSQSKELVKDQEQELNFILKDGGGRNISTLLGFEIQLDESKDDDDVPGGAIWKGKFVNLEAHPTLFKGTKKSELGFEKLKVTFDEEGNAIPQDNKVVTTEKSLAIKLFDYLPLLLEGDEYITVRKNPDQKGSISGKLRVNGTAFVRDNLGIKFVRIKDTYVTPHADTRMVDVEVFHQDVHNSVPELTLNLVGLSDTTVVSLDLYGFKFEVDLTKSKVSQKGLTLSGSVSTPSFGVIDSTHIKVKELSLSTSFGVNAFVIEESALPTLRIKDWSAELGTISLSEDGFEFGGKIKVNAPKSDMVEMAFEKLRLAKDALYGGVFHLPEEGLKVFNIVALKALQNKPLAFNRVGESQVYSLTGSAEFEFPMLINKKIKVNSFHVQTDGAFHLEAPINIAADLGFAKFDITGLEVSNPEAGRPFIGLLGKFKTEIPMIEFEASDLRFQLNSAGNVEYKVGSIKAGINASILKASVSLGFVDNEEARGLEGAGSLQVPNTDILADIQFHFHKLKAGGVDLGASFMAGANIPLGGAVSIVKLGGGFSYNSNRKAFGVMIGGAVSMTGLERAARLDNIELGVEASGAGVVIAGKVDLVIVDVATIGTATVNLNTQQKNFTINVNSKIDFPRQMGNAQIDGTFKVQWDKNDTYAFIGTNVSLDIFGINPQGSVVLAFNLDKTSKHSDPEISKYFTRMDDNLASHANSGFSGIYIDFGFDHRLSFEYSIPVLVDIKAYAYADVGAVVYANFQKNDYLLRLHAKAGYGGEIKFLKGLGTVGLNADAEGLIAGSYLGSNWDLEGRLALSVKAGLGSCWTSISCNDWRSYRVWGVPTGVPQCAKVCLGGHVGITYRNNSFSFSAGLSK